MASLLKSVSGTSVQRGDDKVVASLEQLEEEMIIKMMSFLTPWEAMALEATNKRMRGLVRAQQMVQKFVDISYPFIEDGDSRKLQLGEAIENTVLSRFGPKLLKISHDAKNTPDGSLFKSTTFVEQLAVKCPNLIELPTEDFGMLRAYTGCRESGIKKMTIYLKDFNDAIGQEVKTLIRETPLLEAFQVCTRQSFNHSEEKSIFLINEIEQTLLPTNCIRNLFIDLCSGTITELGIYPAIQRLVQKLSFLKEFTLHGGFNRVEHYEPMLHLFQGIECSKKLMIDEQSPLNKYPLKTYVRSTVRSLSRTYNCLTGEDVLEVANLDSLHALSIFEHYEFENLLPPLVLPRSVREVKMKVNERHFNYFASCMRDYGKKLLKIKISCEDMSAKSFNQLIASIAEGCSKLESFELASRVNVLRRKNLMALLSSCGKTLKKLTFGPVHFSIGLLELICQECKSIEKLHCTLHLNAKRTSRMKELIYRMDKLRDAKIRLLQGKKKEFYASCHYMNRKMVFS